ncbi:SUB1 [Scenedesmus sp. PABB004]|nr:SUB1 [Scenedesmus sp. PABB004]
MSIRAAVWRVLGRSSAAALARAAPRRAALPAGPSPQQRPPGLHHNTQRRTMAAAGGGARGGGVAATAQQVQAALRALLPTLDIDTTTERQIREQLAASLGPVEAHKKLIRAEIDTYLTDSVRADEATAGGAAPAAASGGDDDFVAAPGAKKRRAAGDAGGGAAPQRPAKSRAGAAAQGGGGAPGGAHPELPGAVQLDDAGLKAARVVTYKGVTRVDLRSFYRPKEGGAPAPTQKGIGLDAAQWAALVAALPRLSAAAAAGCSEEVSVELPGSVHAVARSFQGRPQVDIRERYDAGGGELKPGKRGVTLSPEQFAALAAAAPQLGAELAGAAPPGPPGAGAAPPKAAAPARAAGAAGAAGAGAAAGAAGGAGAAAGGADAAEVDLGGRKRAAISTFTGTACVDLRETYEARRAPCGSPARRAAAADTELHRRRRACRRSRRRHSRLRAQKDGVRLPGKKGIMLKPDQWRKVVDAAPAISAALAARDTGFKLDLGSMRQVSLSNFKGVWYVGVREFYDKAGQLAPGSKGLSMAPEQWNRLVAGMAALDAALARH